ncbi:MAG: UDP-3-O-(3-hydroxymyristoyl)glucosamine N-acyltransferase [Candidatus Thioglobus sp.]|nr:MAG: UDP-3-O-(3-hydroxymyristoyl)glucosamine N-acyltransferase [Candidatus Thioglobus sp.]
MHTLGEIATFIDAELHGNSSLKISSLAQCGDAGKGQLTYIASSKYKKDLLKSAASAVILSKDLLADCPTNALVVEDVYLAFAKISHYFKTKSALGSVHPSAVIETSAIGKNATIGANVVIGKDCKIGADVIIGANVTILQGCEVGNNCIIAAGVVIGSEGFGNALDKDKHWHSIAHLGNVVIGADVNIGANTVIDRGTLTDTQIASGVHLDNLVHIAHNVVIGADTAIAAGVTVGGSAILGKRCQVGGGAVIASHIHLADDTIITGSSTVDKHLCAGHYTGFTSISGHSDWKRNQMWLIKLDKIAHYLNIKLKHLKGR